MENLLIDNQNRIAVDFNNEKNNDLLRQQYDKEFRRVMNDKKIDKLKMYHLTENGKYFYFLPDLVPVDFTFKNDNIPFLGKERYFNYLICDLKTMGNFGCFEMIKEVKTYENTKDDLQGLLTNNVQQDEKYNRLIFVSKRTVALQRSTETIIPKTESDLILDFATFIKLFL